MFFLFLLPRFLGGHPVAAAFVQRLMQKPIPASYAQASYHAEHAFRFTAADGTSRFGRYHFIPEAGESYLSPDEGGKRSPNFLRDELEARLRGPSRAIRRTTPRPCGPPIGRASSWAVWR